MSKLSAFCILPLVILGGCIASKVDGNRVNYANGMSFEISDAYAPIGKAPFVSIVKEYEFGIKGTGSAVVHIYAKKNTQDREHTEFIAAYDFQVPTRWRMRKTGVVLENYFLLDINDTPAVGEILQEKGIRTASQFLCGEYFIYTFTSGRQSMLYCASEKAFKSTEDPKSFLKERFLDSVHVVSGEEMQLIKQGPNPTQNRSHLPGAVPNRGKYVVISYSKSGGATYPGRSDTSVEDALNNAVSGCQYSDCQGIWVSNVDGCVAFAKHRSGAWGKARGKDAMEASAKALKLCNAHTTTDDCEVAATLCPEY
jgi:hypothetical protein